MDIEAIINLIKISVEKTEIDNCDDGCCPTYLYTIEPDKLIDNLEKLNKIKKVKKEVK